MTAPVRTHEHQVTLMRDDGSDFDRLWVTDPAGWLVEVGVTGRIDVDGARVPSEWLVEVRHPSGVMQHRKFWSGAVYSSGAPWDGDAVIDAPATIERIDRARADVLAWAAAFAPKLVDPRPARAARDR